MNISKINELKLKALKEAQKEIDKVMRKYSKEMNILIANEIELDCTLVNENCESVLFDKDNKQIDNGCCNGYSKNKNLSEIAHLQKNQSCDINIRFSINEKIKGNKQIIK